MDSTLTDTEVAKEINIGYVPFLEKIKVKIEINFKKTRWNDTFSYTVSVLIKYSGTMKVN